MLKAGALGGRGHDDYSPFTKENLPTISPLLKENIAFTSPSAKDTEE